MKLHRFIGDFTLSKPKVEIKNPENIKQIKGVLRLGEGDFLILCDGRGAEAEVEIESIEKSKIIVSVIKKLQTVEPSRKVSLYLAILKKENFELAVQKAVECGVSQIIPIITERTIKTGLNTERLKKIILEASEQCGRTRVPHLENIINFEPALAYASAGDEKFIFHPESSGYSPKESAKSVSIFVGPEGGFTEEEITLARTAGFRVASLGPLILRGETAAIVATYRAVNGI